MHWTRSSSTNWKNLMELISSLLHRQSCNVDVVISLPLKDFLVLIFQLLRTGNLKELVSLLMQNAAVRSSSKLYAAAWECKQLIYVIGPWQLAKAKLGCHSIGIGNASHRDVLFFYLYPYKLNIEYFSSLTNKFKSKLI